ncbi:hypothetical protein [Crateriforma conspicua]|uniref:DUF8091 domain-containing protein n=1 Tax=Crateriforma conspicua TaxID=2527996 RepID=A0A5C5Y319_9PLAN|nr:hypothetical protein [Crateriforma conspicua]QDV63711.1 hypothetical protein Mal65_28570 [Crateriforma conspicua]TWT69093.1 hypothetical protein Pan14r_13770 [Crateriforma conspicua]
METTLHRQLKELYAGSPHEIEMRIGRYRIDALRGDELIEVQCASLSAIGRKIADLVKRHRVRVVKPVVHRTRILKSKKKDGPITSRRLSPKKGGPLDLFEDLIYFTRLFPHPNLVIEAPCVDVQQLRIPTKGRRRRRRWNTDYDVADVMLESIGESIELRDRDDLLALVGLPSDGQTFDTADLAKRIDRPRWVAQKIAYVLRQTGAIEAHGRKRSGILYKAA